MKNKIYFDKIPLLEYNGETCAEIFQSIYDITKLSSSEIYLTKNGKLYTDKSEFQQDGNIQIHLRLNGGKGGFGSMLRAIGAQIEKTTNKEACRDLSGRRLRDINEEKKLKAWLEKQKEREDEAKEKKKRKLQKLTTVPKHEFKDSKYEDARSELTEKMSESVEEGFKKAEKLRAEKRKCEDKIVKKKIPLFFDEEISSGSESDTSSDSNNVKSKKSRYSSKEDSDDESTSSLSNESTSNEMNSSNITEKEPTDKKEIDSIKESSKQQNISEVKVTN